MFFDILPELTSGHLAKFKKYQINRMIDNRIQSHRELNISEQIDSCIPKHVRGCAMSNKPSRKHDCEI